MKKKITGVIHGDVDKFKIKKARFIKKYKEVLKIASKFDIKVIYADFIPPDVPKEKQKDYHSSSGQWMYGKEIMINVNNATRYTILHEIGHVICGYMCCREHCEYAAHGAALALAKTFNINLHPKAKREIDCYAGWSKSCPAEEKNEKK